jgi:predicted membrane chloride channel (bestrophin family)
LLRVIVSVSSAVVTELIHRGSGNKEFGEAMLEALAGLEALMADSERILKTPIPLSYTRQAAGTTGCFLPKRIILSIIPEVHCFHRITAAAAVSRLSL